MSPAIFHLVERYVKEQRERDQNVTLFTEDIVSHTELIGDEILLHRRYVKQKCLLSVLL